MKHNARWQHLHQMENVSFWELQTIFSSEESNKLFSGTSNAIMPHANAVYSQWTPIENLLYLT